MSRFRPRGGDSSVVLPLRSPAPDPGSRSPWTEGAGESVQRLDRRVIWRWRASGVGGVLLAALAVAASGAWLPIGVSSVVLALAVSVVGLPAAWVVPSLRHRAWGYHTAERELWVRRGVWLRVTSVIPLDRIQHVDTRQDVLEERLGLARVAVFTAGIQGAETVIPGIPVEEAEALRDRVLAWRGAVDVV